ncbi:MAG: (2Fe-2S)-binding protein [Actinobacteria bacterium]|nr:(2Fe-2S)-binding protein [Actinomycetota bacterium]
MSLIINGAEYELASPPLTSLLNVLREEVGLLSPKAGCQQGGCGTCTVLIDGEPRRACLTPLGAIEGAAITTVEGLGDPRNLSPVQAAFHEHYAAQCGFCTPGMMMAATGLLARRPDATRDDVLEALAGHFCRCTGYVKIVDAVLSAAAGRVDTTRPEPEAEPGEPSVVIPGSPA